MKVLEIFFDPSAVFNRIQIRPNWLVPFVVAVLLGIASVFLISPTMELLFLRTAPPELTEEMKQRALEMIRYSRYFGVATTPLIILIKWTLTSFLLYAFAVLFGAETSFRKTLSVLAHASIISALESALSTLVLFINGAESIRSAQDIQPSLLSLGSMFSGDLNPAVQVLLQNLSILTFWYLGLLVVGMAITARMSRFRSAMVVASVWILQLGFVIGANLLFSKYSKVAV